MAASPEFLQRRYMFGRVWKDGVYQPYGPMRLLPGGKIGEYAHANESSWELREGSLVLLNQTGGVTSTFNIQDMKWDCFLGHYHTTNLYHYLLPIHEPEHLTGRQSWDCFDTLVGRRCVHPVAVFEIIEKATGIPGFTAARRAAEGATRSTLDAIYASLAGVFKWSESETAAAKAREIDEEVNQAYPIVANMGLVRDGDLIISDMYLPAEAIRRILVKCGLTASVEILVTYGGKSSGATWRDPLARTTQCHYGDAVHGDVANPRAAGLEALFFRDSNIWEYAKHVPSLYPWLRHVVRSNPYHISKDCVRSQLWTEQVLMNIPFLCMGVKWLQETLKREPVFIYRDCCLLTKLYECITGKKAEIVNISRNALAEASADGAYAAYLRGCLRDRTVVDIRASGRSLKGAWARLGLGPMDQFSMVALAGINTNVNCIPVMMPPELTRAKWSIESFNQDVVGSLITYRGDTPVRAPHENHPDLIDVAHKAVDAAVALWPLYKPDLSGITPGGVAATITRHSSTITYREIDIMWRHPQVDVPPEVAQATRITEAPKAYDLANALFNVNPKHGFSRPPLLHSLSTFSNLLLDIAETAGVNTVCEIGVEGGGMTRRWVDYCAGRAIGKVLMVDTDPNSLQQFNEGERLSKFCGRSLDAIPRAGAIDMWSLDGDHNWFTVYNELTAIKVSCDRHKKPLLAVIYDVGWPWGRRDQYYDPSSIPDEFLLPNSSSVGVDLNDMVHSGSGFRSNGKFFIALRAGGERNGVLTAIEDFIKMWSGDFDLYLIPAVFGLGVLVSRTHPASDALAALLKPLHHNQILAELEFNRLTNYLTVIK
jgi:hypothetical protein